MQHFWRITYLCTFGFLATTLFTLTSLWNRLDPGALPKAPTDGAPIVRAPALQPPAPLNQESPCRNIYRIVCQKKGLTRDPTGTVRPDLEGELEALRIYEEVIRENPGSGSEQADEELVRRIYTPKARARLESAHRWVLKILERIIERQPEGVFTRPQKKLLRLRLRQTVLELPSPISIYADEPELFTKNDALYERLQDGRRRLRIGGAYLLTATSWFNLVFTLAHELAHSIDPCELQIEGITLPAYVGLSACFLKNGLLDVRARTECGANDQLSETFADWLAAQVVAEALVSFATEFRGSALLSAVTNSVRDLCEQDDPENDLDTEFHPAPEIRIDRIFGRNPRIRVLLGCEPPRDRPEYCGFRPVIPQKPNRFDTSR